VTRKRRHKFWVDDRRMYPPDMPTESELEYLRPCEPCVCGVNDWELYEVLPNEVIWRCRKCGRLEGVHEEYVLQPYYDDL